ncbi:hypothetical protein MDAP_000673 [Mitosporidium daphniae]|uniref:30S ribosomal protein S17 n=1 Tax=Mitosporidium daphniae TaxID=1485682 RepID=A0A098VTW0_9MICR|nr:30S ribosomal protein S17 [Mitosporidium daphniae]KGG52360.1 30S ribosomal protein S17 [Mitosporidium daphniae]|eukprot:XP_013238796.1 30S ribosomal protein S17 [Mitosporidium daphniae]
MKQRFIGQVVGTAMRKTAKVQVERMCPLPNGKQHFVRSKFLAHDEQEETVIGDKVAIEAIKPVSKRKAFQVVGIVQRARRFVDPDTGLTYTSA